MPKADHFCLPAGTKAPDIFMRHGPIESDNDR
jgi:hypothetical protein